MSKFAWSLVDRIIIESTGTAVKTYQYCVYLQNHKPNKITQYCLYVANLLILYVQLWMHINYGSFYLKWSKSWLLDISFAYIFN